MTYLVIGATGQQGGAVARALRERGLTVRALVRNPRGEQAKGLKILGIELIEGDLFDRASIDRAMVGISRVFSVQTSSPAGEISDDQEVEQGIAIAESALACGVEHLLYSSGGAAGKGLTGMGHFDSKTRIEEHLRSLPLPSTITRPASFMEMMMLPGMGLPEGRFSFFMEPDQSMQMIALADLGRINAAILSQPERHVGRTIELSGAAVTGTDLQRAFTRAAGRPIAYHRFSDEILASNAFLRRLTELVDDGTVAGHADIAALEAEFGPMLTLESWLEGPGKPLFQAALIANVEQVALR